MTSPSPTYGQKRRIIKKRRVALMSDILKVSERSLIQSWEGNRVLRRASSSTTCHLIKNVLSLAGNCAKSWLKVIFLMQPLADSESEIVIFLNNSFFPTKNQSKNINTFRIIFGTLFWGKQRPCPVCLRIRLDPLITGTATAFVVHLFRTQSS